MIKKVTMVGGDHSQMDVCPVESTSNETYNVTTGEFEWDGATQTMALNGGSIGMIVTYLISARLCELFGVKRLVGYSLLISGVLDCLQPTFIRLNVWIYITVLIIRGICLGTLIPGFNIILARWINEKERLQLASFIFSAQILGTLLAMFTAGTIVTTFGWQGAFYINGSLTLPFFISWMYFMYDSPSQHPRISEEEINYLLRSTNMDNMVVPVAPWLEIITNLPLWAHISVNLAVAWISFTIATELPLYLTKVLNYSINQTSLISALPHLAQLTSNVFCALLSQWIRNKGYLSKMTCYRIFNVIATFGPAIMMITIPQLGCDHGAIVGVLVVAMFLNGAYYGGSFMNILDLGPNYAGSIAAFVSTFSSTIQFVAPMLAGILTDKNTLSAWNTVFYISAAITSLPVTLYFIFGSTDEQPWNKINSCNEVGNGNEKHINWDNKLTINDGKCDEIIKQIGDLKYPEKEEK
ncbi:unnamed protein product [Timema podura]|uniref:Major facilitator superfamily (MFS) profile domain-containing protein n=1 Tax=Timema podura TaxID=61482 RepID=A0ABN7NL63_TIMPD|nr:unnamed protein product [Timema podura]